MPSSALRDILNDDTPSGQQCTLVTTAAKLCTTDVIAIVAVTFSLWYVVWGIPMTIRAFQRLRAKSIARRALRKLKTRVHLNDDLEMETKENGSDDRVACTYSDPYLASTKRLRTFLHLRDKIIVPEQAYNPKPEEAEHTWQERERLDSFKFPSQPTHFHTSAPSLRTLESYPASSIAGLYSPPSQTHVFGYDELPSPVSASFRFPPGLAGLEVRHLKDLDACDRLDPLPSSPPPAYLYHLSS
ncbi:hypothetical protein BD414DRAFT_494246 [Trametes punicea]|nr:hypothetical protein BD414DRAFT_494246 [Trametes punicea]